MHATGAARMIVKLFRCEIDERLIRNGVDEPEAEQRRRASTCGDRRRSGNGFRDELMRASVRRSDRMILNQRSAEL